MRVNEKATYTKFNQKMKKSASGYYTITRCAKKTLGRIETSLA